MKQKCMDMDSVFQKINESYESLVELAGRENVEVAHKRIRDELIISICGIYFNPQIKYEDVSYNTETYSAEIIEKINECLSKYEKSSSKQNGVSFSKYVCSSIHKMLASLKAEEAFKKKNGGQKISRDALSLMNKVKDQDRVFEGFGTTDESKRNKKIAISLGITEQKVLEMKSLLKLTAVSDEQTSDDGNSYSLFDDAGKHVDYSSSEKILQKERLVLLFDCIQEEWEKKSDSELSEILTADVLYQFKGKAPERKPEETENVVVFSSALGFNLGDFVSMYSFVDKKMAVCFFTDAEYELPSQVELAAKFNKTKSGISKQLSRFYEKVAKKLAEDENYKILYKKLSTS